MKYTKRGCVSTEIRGLHDESEVGFIPKITLWNKSLHFRPQNVEIFDFFVQKPVLCEQPLYFLSVIILCWLTTAKKKNS